MTKTTIFNGAHGNSGVNDNFAQRVIKEAYARKLWANSSPAAGTRAEDYLLSRCIANDLPATVHYVPPVSFANDNGEKASKPGALIVPALNRFSQMVGVHCTYINQGGAADGAKSFIGTEAGSTVRFGKPSTDILLTTGIEEALALRLLYPDENVWTVFSAENLEKVQLPSYVQHVSLCVGSSLSDRIFAECAVDEFSLQGVSAETDTPALECESFNEMWAVVKAAQAND